MMETCLAAAVLAALSCYALVGAWVVQSARACPPGTCCEWATALVVLAAAPLVMVLVAAQFALAWSEGHDHEA